MKTHLISQAILKYLSGLMFLILLIFIPAGSLDFWKGWLLVGLVFLPMLLIGILLFLYKPDLLRKRLEMKEKEKEQKQIIFLSALLFLATFILAGLDYRFSWLQVPSLITWCASFIFLASYLLYAEVLRENNHLFRIIDVQDQQNVISTGLYGIVRHPMYLATLGLFLSIPLILGSLLAFLVMLLYLPIINQRIKGEEAFLEKNLEGYQEYKNQVTTKIIPFLW